MNDVTSKRALPFSGHAIVAFVDLLGFSHRVKSMTGVEEEHKLLEDLECVHQNFRAAPFDIGEEDPFEDLVFTDCVVSALKLNGPIGKAAGAEHACLTDLYRLAYAQAACVGEGIFVRGGVDTGF